MDPEEQRKQMNQRYVAGKFLDGESLGDIADGLIDPVEQIDYISGSPERIPGKQADSPPNSSAPGMDRILFWTIITLVALLLLWLNDVLRSLYA